LSILDGFEKFFAATQSTKFLTKPILDYLCSSKEYITFVQGDYILGAISYRILSTLQLTSGESISSRHVSVQMVDILNTFCEQTLANNLHFSCLWFKWLLPMVSDFYCVGAWWSIGLPC